MPKRFTNFKKHCMAYDSLFYYGIVSLGSSFRIMV
jgi:hypothetical protein